MAAEWGDDAESKQLQAMLDSYLAAYTLTTSDARSLNVVIYACYGCLGHTAKVGQRRG